VTSSFVGPLVEMDGSASVVWWPAASLPSAGAERVRGAPQRVRAPESVGGEAVRFDGLSDALLLPENPLAGASCFTVEALLTVASGGPVEQRILHLQSHDSNDRLLLETRRGDAAGATWYADTIVSSDGRDSILVDPNQPHAADRWCTLAVTCDGEQMQQFVDGTLELAQRFTPAPFPAGAVCLGMRMNHVTPFRGSVAAVRFSRFARAASELWRLPDHGPQRLHPETEGRAR
jgi:hypothetical protein